MNNKILLCMAALFLPNFSFAEAPEPAISSEQLKPLNNVRVSMQRMLRSAEGRYFLDLYAGVWNPKAKLYDELEHIETEFKGAQKGDALELNSVGDAELSRQTKLSGNLNANSGVFDAVLVTSNGPQNIRFTPVFKAEDKPVLIFKFYGLENAQQPYGKSLLRIDVIDKLTGKLRQQLTGFNAFANSVGYMDVNFDGYYDLVLSDTSNEQKTEDKRFIYWMYNPKTKMFQRSRQLENIVGFPRLYGDKQQIDFGGGQLYQVTQGLLNRVTGAAP